jgi:hypothetical protein
MNETIVKCPTCNKDRLYKTKRSARGSENRSCKSCANSLKKGGLGTVYKEDGQKRCTQCKQYFPLSNYYKNDNSYASTCKCCSVSKSKAFGIEYRFIQYGITSIIYHEMLKGQEGKCKICNMTPDDTLHIDHCHTTGKVRGLLCKSCNTALGLFKDNKDSLKSALIYLDEVEENQE